MDTFLARRWIRDPTSDEQGFHCIRVILLTRGNGTEHLHFTLIIEIEIQISCKLLSCSYERKPLDLFISQESDWIIVPKVDMLAKYVPLPWDPDSGD